MTELRHTLAEVQKAGAISQGGNQGWLSRGYLRQNGCGLVSCTDVLLYLHRHRAGCRMELFRDDPGENELYLPQYERWTEQIRRKYLPVIPHVGTTGFLVAGGLNRCFSHCGIPLRASWCVLEGRLWERMEAMLREDIPVILAVGANLPLPLNRKKLMLYRNTEGVPAVGISAHFVTVTGLDREWMRVSSWGREYYIRRAEFSAYVRKHSGYAVSNLVWIRPV